MPYRTRAQEALDRWRVLDRALERLRADDPIRQALEREREAAHAEYEAIVEEARRVQLPELPPFPDRREGVVAAPRRP
jgi:hypothetical protein